MENIKVLFFLNKPLGELGMGASNMLPKYAKKNGLEVTLLTPVSRDNGLMSLDFRREEKVEYRSHNFFSIFKLLRKTIKDKKPDIIHFYWHPMSFRYAIMLKLFRIKGSSAKILIDIRSPAIITKKRSVIKRYIDPIKQIGFDQVFTHEYHSAATHLKRVFIPLHVVPPGFDPEILKTKRTFISNSYPKIIYIGSISKERKIEELLKILIKVRLKTKVRFEIDFFGNGNYVNELKNYISENNLQQSIRYRGVLPQKELFKKMNEYDAGLSFIPYLHYQSAPSLKTIEYMSMGLYVLGSDTQGNKDYVTNDDIGLLSANNADVFSDMVVEYINNFSIYKSTISKAKIEIMSWDSIVKNNLIPQYIKLLK